MYRHRGGCQTPGLTDTLRLGGRKVGVRGTMVRLKVHLLLFEEDQFGDCKTPTDIVDVMESLHDDLYQEGEW